MPRRYIRGIFMIQTVKNIEKILRQIYDHDYYTVVRDFFEMSAIAVRNAVDYSEQRGEYEDRYRQIAKTYTQEQLAIFSQALGIFIQEIKNTVDGKGSFYDWAGELYMNSETNNKNLGQFFTPYHVSQLMSRVTIDTDAIKQRITKDPDTVITINEPTCGAGGIIVAAIETLHNAGINYAWNVFVDCTDIDSNCVYMTYLTLSLLGVPAVVRLGDSLMLKYRASWYTPAYIFACAHFNLRLTSTTSTTPISTPVTTPTQSEPKEKKIDKTGQYKIIF